MKNKVFKALRGLLVAFALIVMCAVLLPTQAQAAEVASGTCGDNLTWELTDDGVLTISGTGSMYNYDKSENLAPWFTERTNITEVVIEEGVTSIGEYAFYASTKLIKITIPKSVARYGFHAFENCSQFKKINITDLKAWCSIDFNIDYSPYGVIFNNPLFYAGNLYVNDQKVSDLIIPENITKIGKYTFAGCTSITSATLPAGFKIISEGSFLRCSNLSSIVLPNGLTKIGQEAFFGCSSLASIAIPESVTNIYYEAFGQCNNLASVHITNLKAWCSIVYESWDGDDGCNPLGNGAALYLNNVIVDDLVIPDDIKLIRSKAFVGCSSLTSVVIGDGTLSLEYGIFEKCKNLAYVKIGNSIASLEPSLFDSCTSLTSVIIGEGVISIDRAFSDCHSLWHVLYAGSEEQWNRIEIDEFFPYLTVATRHYNYSGVDEIDPINKVCSICRANCTHIWGNGNVMKESTCKEEGVKTYTCTVCKETKTEAIAKLSTHSYDNGKVTKEATCKEEGVKTYTCTVCKETKTEAIAKLTTHTPGAEATATTPQICTVCGKELKPATGATEPPATEPPATEPPATEPPATEPPATEPPATEPPATEPTVTPTQPEGNKNPDDGEFPIMVVIAIVVLGGGGATAGVILWKKKH